jgi:hypothetical protein
MTDKGAVIAFEYQFSARKWVAYDDAINKLLRKGFFFHLHSSKSLNAH